MPDRPRASGDACLCSNGELYRLRGNNGLYQRTATRAGLRAIMPSSRVRSCLELASIEP